MPVFSDNRSITEIDKQSRFGFEITFTTNGIL